MKRDLLAAFTFILSGFLFYTVGQGAEVKDRGPSGLDCVSSQAIVVVDDGGMETPVEISFQEEGGLDS